MLKLHLLSSVPFETNGEEIYVSEAYIEAMIPHRYARIPYTEICMSSGMTYKVKEDVINDYQNSIQPKEQTNQAESPGT